MSNPPPHSRYQAHLSRTPSPNKDPDAGLRGLGHYERRLPKWRFWLRQHLIPIVRWETPYLANMQLNCRTPALDTYFAFTANLGTHTFFMTALPICIWCGYPDAGIALVHMLAMGVYFSGFVKDLVCLPRPLSPPLHRITMSGSAALEYGFPSTHTTNAISVALFCIERLHSSRHEYQTLSYILLIAGCYIYVISISLGRMYCGMHGFFDVLFGGILGAVITWLRITYGPLYDLWILTGDWFRPLITVAILAVAVRIYPEPADNCPCFDDSVAFLGVVMGTEVGIWHYSSGNPYHASNPASPLADVYPFTEFNLLKIAARIVIGVIVIFVWRALMKPLLLRGLPPIFRFVDQWGFRLPRRYFLQSRDYEIVPPLRKDDNIIPPASEIPAMMSNLGHPRRRTVSIGPQSEADAREFIANREAQKRRNSRSEAHQSIRRPLVHKQSLLTTRHTEADSRSYVASSNQQDRSPFADMVDSLPTQNRESFLQVAQSDPALLTPPPSDGGASSDGEDAKHDKEMFCNLEKPRIRYDVEVITKLVVYAGIAWWALEGNPFLFETLGLI